MNLATKILCLMVVFTAFVYGNAQSQATLSALSSNESYKLEEQVVSLVKKRRRIELGISWKKSNPIVFSKRNRDLYIHSLENILSDWDGYLSQTTAANQNILNLGYLPTYRGELHLMFFRNLADGRSLPDNQPRLWMTYCKNNNEGCISGQVHFYTKEQVAILRDIISENL